MTTDAPDAALEDATRELLSVLRDLEAAVEPPGPRRLVRPPTPRGFLEFTSEVGIPAAILVLRTNIKALELLQRTLRMMGDHDTLDGQDTPVRDRAAGVTAASLSRLDAALAELQTAIDGRSTDRSPEELLEEARRRTEELEARLEATGATGLDERLGPRGATGVDVEAELDSLRQSVDADDGANESSGDGTDDSQSPAS